MPVIDKSLEELKVYRGITPCPADFDDYWNTALRELEATDPQAELVPNTEVHPASAELFDLWFRGVGGARIYAKYARPRKPRSPGPAVPMFHGYGWSSSDWVEKTRLHRSR